MATAKLASAATSMAARVMLELRARWLKSDVAEKLWTLRLLVRVDAAPEKCVRT